MSPLPHGAASHDAVSGSDGAAAVPAVEPAATRRGADRGRDRPEAAAREISSSPEAPVRPSPSREAERGARTRLDLSIGELVLHGFPEQMRERVGAAIQRELERLFADDETLCRGSSASDHLEIEGGAFTVQPGTPPEIAGREIARAIARGLKTRR
ncbi:MAG: hypothetical protein JST22_12705 [Bacteroidetes bacterium]|nr:hypothetical protein [Bacteroidota bacterium]